MCVVYVRVYVCVKCVHVCVGVSAYACMCVYESASAMRAQLPHYLGQGLSRCEVWQLLLGYRPLSKERRAEALQRKREEPDAGSGSVPCLCGTH